MILLGKRKNKEVVVEIYHLDIHTQKLVFNFMQLKSILHSFCHLVHPTVLQSRKGRSYTDIETGTKKEESTCSRSHDEWPIQDQAFSVYFSLYYTRSLRAPLQPSHT